MSSLKRRHYAADDPRKEKYERLRRRLHLSLLNDLFLRTWAPPLTWRRCICERHAGHMMLVEFRNYNTAAFVFWMRKNTMAQVMTIDSVATRIFAFWFSGVIVQLGTLCISESFLGIADNAFRDFYIAWESALGEFTHSEFQRLERQNP